jgi:hypothetical protein
MPKSSKIFLCDSPPSAFSPKHSSASATASIEELRSNSYGESSIPMEGKHTYSRSLTPKHHDYNCIQHYRSSRDSVPSRDKANDIITKREAQLPYLGERSDNALAVGFIAR